MLAHLRLATLLVIALAMAGLHAADEPPGVLAQLGSEEIYEGESVDFQVTLQNIKTPVRPDLSEIEANFSVTALGDRSLNSTSLMIINGKRFDQSTYGHAYVYRLTPKKSGALIIPAPSVTVDGMKLFAQNLSLRVIAAEKQDLVLLEIEAGKAKVYPTQPFEVTLRVFVKPVKGDVGRDPVSLLAELPHLQINWAEVPEGLQSDDHNAWLKDLVSNTGRGFALNNFVAREFFNERPMAFNLYHGREKRKGLDGEEIEYFVYELTRQYRAQKTGSYHFGPALLKGRFIESIVGRRGNFRKLVVSAPARTVEVAEVPAPRPATFCGAIGDYKLSASASPIDLRVGDPFTLVLELERQLGAGWLDLLSAPDLSAHADLTRDFEIIDKAPTGVVKGMRKTFAYGLRPKKAGVGIPAISVSLFDPETESYRELQTKAIPLNVTKATQLNVGELVGAAGSAGNARDIHSSAQGIFQNVTDLALLADERIQPLNYVAGAAGAWAAFALLALALTALRRRANDAVWQRRQYARSQAQQNLRTADAAAAQGRGSEALRSVRAALVGLVADMFNLPATGMTAHETEAALKHAGVAEPVRARAASFLQSIEAMEYGSAPAQDVKKLVDGVEGFVPELHRELQARTADYSSKLSRAGALSLLLILSWLPISAQAEERPQREREFVRALELFDKAKLPDDYRNVADAFEALLADGYENGAVYYNLGNARLRAGQFGKAIAAYRKAKLYRPRDTYLDANLKNALSLAPGRLPEAPLPWWKMVLFWSDWLSYPEKFRLLFAAFSLGALIAAAGLLTRRTRAYRSAAALVLVALLLSLEAAVAHVEVQGTQRAVISIAETVARKGMAQSYDPAFTQSLRDGAEFTVIDRAGGWVLGHFEGIGDGWLPSEAVHEY